MIYGICISTIHQSYFSITPGTVTYTLLQDFNQGKRHCNSFLYLQNQLNLSCAQESSERGQERGLTCSIIHYVLT